jgi:hypothetical protein
LPIGNLRVQFQTSLLDRKVNVATALGLAPLKSEGVTFVPKGALQCDIPTLPAIPIGSNMNPSATLAPAQVFPD